MAEFRACPLAGDLTCGGARRRCAHLRTFCDDVQVKPEECEACVLPEMLEALRETRKSCHEAGGVRSCAVCPRKTATVDPCQTPVLWAKVAALQG